MWIFFLLSSCAFSYDAEHVASRGPASVGPARSCSAEIYDLDAPASAPKLFSFFATSTLEGISEKIQIEVRDPQNSLVAFEDLKTKSGELVSYEIRENFLNTLGKISLSDGKLNYFFKDKNGKEHLSQDTQTESEPTLTGPMLFSYLREHLSELTEGKKKTIPFHFNVPQELDSFSFEFAVMHSPQDPVADEKDNAKSKESTASKDAVRYWKIRMKPRSIFVAAVVDPIYFYFEADSLRPLKIEGLTFLKTKKQDAWKDLKARTVFKSCG